MNKEVNILYIYNEEKITKKIVFDYFKIQFENLIFDYNGMDCYVVKTKDILIFRQGRAFTNEWFLTLK